MKTAVRSGYRRHPFAAATVWVRIVAGLAKNARATRQNRVTGTARGLIFDLRCRWVKGVVAIL
ncbi:hypothetical protein ACFFYR_32855 [Paraburkholderia dipogonis]|uniref:hypothetical protein n=1 Tax=Paraburkholderia dipogonis TaxID=1211383 RepID=UPI0035ECAB1C